MSNSMTVTRALAEIKTLDSRINHAIQQGVFVAAVRGTRKVPLNQAKSAEELSKDIEASYQSVDALIARRDAIKRGVIKSNGYTGVRISDVSMTVAEAIERKSSIQYKKSLLQHLMVQHMNATTQVHQQNAKMEQDIEKRVMAAYGNDKGKVTEEQHKLIASAVKGEAEASLLDPKKIEDQIKALRKEVEDFETEVDFVLSESNAKTYITLD